jgi:DnaJ-class molecular chaperone
MGTKVCPTCKGAKRVIVGMGNGDRMIYGDCPTCKGTGEVTVEESPPAEAPAPCPECKGLKKVVTGVSGDSPIFGECPLCHGSGTAAETPSA